MSCVKCEEMDDKNMVAYYRVDKANVGIIGCDEHVNKLMRAMDNRGEDRMIYRIAARPSRKKLKNDPV